MGVWDKIKKSISPGEDDDNTYDDDEFEDEYTMGGGYKDFTANDMPVGGNFNQHNQQTYAQGASAYSNFQQPVNNSLTTTSVTSASGGDLYASFEVKIVKPESYPIDGKRIADLLMARKTVIINFDDTNKEVVRKLKDFIFGIVYAIKGDFNKVSENTFIATPPNAKVSAAQAQMRASERGESGRDRDASIY